MAAYSSNAPGDMSPLSDLDATLPLQTSPLLEISYTDVSVDFFEVAADEGADMPGHSIAIYDGSGILQARFSFSGPKVAMNGSGFSGHEVVRSCLSVGLVRKLLQQYRAPRHQMPDPKPYSGQNTRIAGIETATTRISSGSPMRQ